LFFATASRRSLIVAPSTVTESVLAQPLLALLRRFDAFGRLDVLADAGVAPLFRAMSEPDEVIETDIGLERVALLRRLALSRRIEAGSYDCAYILQEARVAGMAPWLARIPRRMVVGADLSRRGPPAAARTGARDRPVGDRFIAMAFPPGEAMPSGIPAPQIVSPPEMTEGLARRLSLDLGSPWSSCAPPRNSGRPANGPCGTTPNWPP
jgi:heptosyltransferase-2